MRARSLYLIGLFLISPAPLLAQSKLAPKAAGPETRYFTSIDGLMDYIYAPDDTPAEKEA